MGLADHPSSERKKILTEEYQVAPPSPLESLEPIGHLWGRAADWPHPPAPGI